MTPCYRSPCQRLQSLGYRQYATGYTMLDTWFIYRQCSFFFHVTGNLNCPVVYDRDTCRTCTRPKELSEIVSKCWCFRRECEHDNLVLRVLSQGCVSEYTTQEPFSNNELCCFDIEPWVREPKSQSLSTQSEQVTHLNIETHHKTLWVSTGNKMEKKEKWYKKKKEGKSKLALCACPSARMAW